MANEKEKVEVYHSPAQIKIRERDRFKTEISWIDEKFFIPVNFDIVKEDAELFANLLEEHCKRKGITQKDSTKMNLEQQKKVFAEFDVDLQKKYRVKYTEENAADFEEFVKEYCTSKGINPSKITPEQKNKLFEQFDPRLRVEMQYTYMAYNYDLIEMMQDYDKQHGKSVFKYVTYREMLDIYVNGTMKKEDIKHEMNPSNDDCLTHIRFARLSDEISKHRDKGLAMAIEPQILGLV